MPGNGGSLGAFGPAREGHMSLDGTSGYGAGGVLDPLRGKGFSVFKDRSQFCTVGAFTWSDDGTIKRKAAAFTGGGYTKLYLAGAGGTEVLVLSLFDGSCALNTAAREE